MLSPYGMYSGFETILRVASDGTLPHHMPCMPCVPSYARPAPMDSIPSSPKNMQARTCSADANTLSTAIAALGVWSMCLYPGLSFVCAELPQPPLPLASHPNYHLYLRPRTFLPASLQLGMFSMQVAQPYLPTCSGGPPRRLSENRPPLFRRWLGASSRHCRSTFIS